MPEAKLAREAEISYALIALVTDYDSWRPKPADQPKSDATTLLNETQAQRQRAGFPLALSAFIP